MKKYIVWYIVNHKYNYYIKNNNIILYETLWIFKSWQVIYEIIKKIIRKDIFNISLTTISNVNQSPKVII